MQHLDEGTIHAWLGGALPAEEARQAELHVSACERCAAAVAEARGLIAASSMILSKLDTFPASVDARFEAGVPPRDDIAAARAASEARQRPARRSWFATSGFRAAAAVLVLAGGVAVVQSVTGREELARVVNDQAMESKVTADESVPAEPMVAQDATAASTAQPEAPPPPPVVAAAPVHPRPQPVAGPVRRPTPGEAARLGGIEGTSRARPGGGRTMEMVRVGTDSAVVARGSAEERVMRTEAVAPTAAPPLAAGVAARGAASQGNVLGSAQQQRPADGTDLRQERDFADRKSVV